jgi:hypothetical protein
MLGAVRPTRHRSAARVSRGLSARTSGRWCAPSRSPPAHLRQAVTLISVAFLVENRGSVSLPTRGWPDHRHAVRCPAHGSKSCQKLRCKCRARMRRHLSTNSEPPEPSADQSRFIDHRSPSRRRLTWVAGGTIMAPGGEHGVTTACGVPTRNEGGSDEAIFRTGTGNYRGYCDWSCSGFGAACSD